MKNMPKLTIFIWWVFILAVRHGENNRNIQVLKFDTHLKFK